jgi:hypothetical protein
MFSEWMEVSVSALITDCRYAGLQHFYVMLRRLDYSHRKAFSGTHSCSRRLIKTPLIDSLSDPVGAASGSERATP